MRKNIPTLDYEIFSNVPKILLNRYANPVYDKIAYRRKRINELRLCGYTNQEISDKIKCSISTVEKDQNYIRDNIKRWFESEAIKDYCQSLNDAIVLYDVVIRELQLLYQYEEERRFEILLKIIEFQNSKTLLYEQTFSVRNYVSQTVNVGKQHDK